jgi:acyl carrier protein
MSGMTVQEGDTMHDDVDFYQFKEMIAFHLGVDIGTLTRDTSFVDDLGIDSLSLVNFIITLEKRYTIRIEMNTIWSVKNVGDAYDMFIKKLCCRESAVNKTIGTDNVEGELHYNG